MTGFAGLERDSATGLNLAIYRAQDSRTGRWTSEDPYGFRAADTNLSRYSKNHPSNSNDPFGLIDSVDTTIAEMTAAGDVAGLEGLLTLEGGGLSSAQQAAVNAAVKGLKAAAAAAAKEAAKAAARQVCKATLDRIKKGIKNPHKNDGSTFKNKGGDLPSQPPGYYKEYVVPTPGVKGPGAQRIVQGCKGETYYTPDHYKTFIRID
jgi:RHS repeat-associated protein